MRQDARLVIRMHRGERLTIDRLARMEGLPTSTFARRVLLELAALRGVRPKMTSDNQKKEH